MSLRGRYADARVVFSAARNLAERDTRTVVRLDLLLNDAFNAIQDRHLDEALVLLEEGRRSAGDEPDYRVDFECLVVRLAADWAVEARRAGDRALERRWIETAQKSREWISQFVQSGAILTRTGRHSLPLVEGELARAEGRSTPAAWEAAEAELGEKGFPWEAAYASFRRAEALKEIGANPVVVIAGLDQAEATARAIGADGLARWVEDLRGTTQ